MRVRGTRVLLARYAGLVNRHGPDSREAARFVRRWRGNREFVELAGLARTLKKALTARREER
jgi:hypothetical protein